MTNGLILESFPCEKSRPPRGFEPMTSSIPTNSPKQLYMQNNGENGKHTTHVVPGKTQ